MTANVLSSIPAHPYRESRQLGSSELFEAVPAGIYGGDARSDPGEPAPWLRGRRREREALNGLVADVRTGQSRSLVVRGEEGVGKTALLQYLRDRASGCQLAWSAGVESETGLAFAGLQQLTLRFTDRLDRIPGPQRDALGTALGLQDGGAPDRMLVGLAVLSLLSCVAEDRPLLAVVDDAQWLDRASAQALAFAARRLAGEKIGIVFAVREAGCAQELSGITELVIHGLADGDARALLEQAVAGPLDERVRDRIVAETRGNPLALLTMPYETTPAELAGGFSFPGAGVLPDQTSEIFRRLAAAPKEARLLLLVAAAELVGDPLLVWRAAGQLGVAAGGAAPAAATGLVEFGRQVRFRHPLARSAIYQAAPPEERQSVHRALAEATDLADPDRRAWHRALAATGLDEDVAAELARSADCARGRGALAVTAAFRRSAAELTPDPAARARRALAAAESQHQAGVPESALTSLTMALAGPLDELESARAELLHAQIMSTVSPGRDAPPALLSAAKRLEPLDAALARGAYLDAFSAALLAGHLAQGGDVREIALAVLSAGCGLSAGSSAPASDLLLDGIVVLAANGYAAGAASLKRALEALRAESAPGDGALRWLWLGCRIAEALGDDESWDTLTVRQVRLARDTGALSLLPTALAERSSTLLLTGDFTGAASLTAEAETATAAAGSQLAPSGAISLAAWRGREAEVSELIAATWDEATRRGEGLWLATAEWAKAVLCNGLGRYEQALAAAEAACEYPQELGFSTWALAELIEAAARSKQPGRASGPLRRLSEAASASGTDWALGIEARSRALLSDGHAAEALYREAADRLGRTLLRAELARARLLYGEWLRREGRRVDAREQLRAAHGQFTAMGADGFAERARRELLATGETVRKRTADPREELTAQEAQIARLAADGRTNPEIGAELFISPRTVEWHLRKVYPKLGIATRKELLHALREP
jgi:DNA-binding CsgD family transcriptional regulator